MNEENVAVGEAVLTSGLDQVYPKGLPVGTVIKTAGGNVYKSIVVKPVAALNRLESVLVLLKSASAGQQALNANPRP
jgi:rod shape-determining protein MreC